MYYPTLQCIAANQSKLATISKAQTHQGNSDPRSPKIPPMLLQSYVLLFKDMLCARDNHP